MTHLRYQLGNIHIYKLMVSAVNTLVLASLIFTNFIVLLRFIQAVIWKRVLEFNEDILDRVIIRVTLATSAVLAFVFCKPGKVAVLLWESFDHDLSKDCVDQFNPLDIMQV